MSFRSIALVLTSTMLTSIGVANAAGSIDAGKISFENNCLGCHGMPPNLSSGAGNAAKNPSAIQNAIKRVGQMRFLSTLSTGEIDNIATYLGYPNFTDADCTFNWAEGRLPDQLKPRALSMTSGDYYFRYYAASNWYFATQNGNVLFFDGNNVAAGIQKLGTLSQFYTTAIQADCQ